MYVYNKMIYYIRNIEKQKINNAVQQNFMLYLLLYSFDYCVNIRVNHTNNVIIIVYSEQIIINKNYTYCKKFNFQTF